MICSSRRIAVMDIGSNSIRLVIYEQRENGAYRIISEFKESARLSGRIGTDGALPFTEIQSIVRILSHFKRICTAHDVKEYRVAATAAIRNATNALQIIEILCRNTGFKVELLSGEDEARLGFLGMIQSMDVSDGILVDIGGGSTEVSIFRDRKLMRSISFPFGAVNTTQKFAPSGEFQSEQLQGIRQMVEQAINGEPWIKAVPGMPLVGLGGTIRTLCKINQRKHKYSLGLTHNYTMAAPEMNELVQWLPSLSGAGRKKINGLSKDRHDIIVPGLIILHTIFQMAGASHYIVSGSGLRDGLFYETFFHPKTDNTPVSRRSADNLLALHSTAPADHIEHVSTSSVKLFDSLKEAFNHDYDDRIRLCLETAAKLYRIGASLHYYQYAKHSFHMIAHTRIDGLSHREILLSALVASFKNKKRTQLEAAQHKDILLESDTELVCKLGLLLQLAIALDVSETQAVRLAEATVKRADLQIMLDICHDPSKELAEAESLKNDFKKVWGLDLTIPGPSFSMN